MRLNDLPITEDATAVAAVDLDPYSDAFIADPYPHHAELRDAGPVLRIARYGVHAVARHEQVREVLRDDRTFVSSAGVGLSNFNHEAPLRPKSPLLEADPPAHTRPRALMARVLSPPAIYRLRDALILQAEQQIERLLARGGVIDGIDDLAVPYVLKVFPDAVGIAPGDRSPLLRYGDLLFNAFGPRNALFERAAEGLAPLTAWVMAHCRREALAPGGFGARIHDAADAGEIDAAHAPLLVRSLLSAGLDPVVAGLGHALMLLARHPAQYERLRAEPSLARAAFDEALRLESPLQIVCRTAARDTELAGVPIAAERKVMCFLGAANRDPRRFGDPDRFDIGRASAGLIAFGVGIHACFGQAIARLQGEAVLRALALRVAQIEVAGAARRRPNNTLRTLAALPLRLVPG